MTSPSFPTLCAAGLLAATIALAPPRTSAPPRARLKSALTHDQARDYLVRLINQDRAAKGLTPVLLDAVASAVAQRHAEEMAANRYMAHWDLSGKLPDERYTEAGGSDYARENVFLSTRAPAESPFDGKLELDLSPTYSESEIEGIDAAYFNEVPPNDGHRRNILAPEHTHIGVGLAKAERDGVDTFANDEEFVDRYLAMDPMPAECASGGSVVVSGQTLGDAAVYSISVARAPLPRPMSREELDHTRTYSTPHAFATYWPDAVSGAGSFSILGNGRFRATVRLSEQGLPGVYYVTVHVVRGRRILVGSQRTVVVSRQAATSTQ